MNEQQLVERIQTAAERYPQLAERYRRGATIYRSNHITRIDENRVVVPSQTREGSGHLVENVGGVVYCTCADFSHKAPEVKGQKFCKHVIAVMLWRKNGAYQVQS